MVWRAVHDWAAGQDDGSGAELEAHELVLLGEACRVADRVAQLGAVIDGMDPAAAAVVRLLAEERQQRLALAVLLTARLGLPTGLVEEAPAASSSRGRSPASKGSPRARGSTAASRRAMTAARARWGTTGAAVDEEES